jgi:hypothetical protein
VTPAQSRQCWLRRAREEAELIALGVGRDEPGLLAGLADVGRARPELQEVELGSLTAGGGIDVYVRLCAAGTSPAPARPCG